MLIANLRITGFNVVMLTRAQQEDVWEGLISSATRANCFADLSNRFNTFHKCLLWAMLFFSWLTVSVVVKDWLPKKLEWLRVVLTIITAGLSFLSVLQQYQKRSSDCVDLYYRWNQLATRYDSLWNDMYSPEAEATFRTLREKSDELSRASVSFGRNERLMGKWQTYVEQQYSSVDSQNDN